MISNNLAKLIRKHIRKGPDISSYVFQQSKFAPGGNNHLLHQMQQIQEFAAANGGTLRVGPSLLAIMDAAPWDLWKDIRITEDFRELDFTLECTEPVRAAFEGCIQED